MILRLAKVSSMVAVVIQRTQSSEYLSTKEDLFGNETPRLLWSCFLVAVYGFGHNPIVTITINHITTIFLQSIGEGFPDRLITNEFAIWL